MAGMPNNKNRPADGLGRQTGTCVPKNALYSIKPFFKRQSSKMEGKVGDRFRLSWALVRWLDMTLPPTTPSHPI